MAGQILSMGLGFVAFAYLARTLSPASYGITEYVVGLAALAAIIIEGGLGPVAARDVSRARSTAGLVASRVVGARLLLAAVFVPLVALGGLLTGQPSATWPLFWLFAASLVFIAVKQDWLLQGLERIAHVAPAQALRSGVFLLGVLTLVHGTGDLLLVGAAEVAAAAAAAAYYLLAQRHASVPFRVNAHLAQLVPLMRAGAAVGASNMVWTGMLYSPIFLVTNLSGPAEAAWLGGAQRIVFSLVSFSALYFFNLYPAITRALHTDRSAWERLMASSWRLLAWVSLAGALVASLASELVVVLVYGETFTPAAAVLAVFVWLVPIRLLSGHARWTLVAGGRQGLLLASELIGMVALFISGAILIPRHGALGAAWAMVVANAAGWIAAQILASRYVSGMPGAREMLQPSAAATTAALLAWLVAGGHVLLGVSLVVGTFAVFMWPAAANLGADARRLACARRDPADT